MKPRTSCYFLMLMVNVIAINECLGQCSESANWMRENALEENGNMVIKWNFTDDVITMMMIGRTKGYISVGFAPMMELKEADIVLGWIQNNKSYLQDRYSSNGEEPVLDQIQSLSLLGGKENNTHTCLCFQRKLRSCDRQDFSFKNGTTNVLWAISPEDPVTPTGNVGYLSAQRGQQPVYLLSIQYPKPTSKQIENFDIAPRKNITVKSGSGDTLYWCTNYKLPPFDEKRYMIGYEILIPPNNKDFVHHALLYLCKPEAAAQVYDKIDPNGYNCASSKYRNPCNTEVAVWAKGSSQIYFPENAATPFGNDTEEFYFKTEIHYAISNLKQDISDNTTIRILITKQRPQFEIGILNTGLQITPIHLIPPKQKAYSTFAICGGSCIQQNFPKQGYINILAVRFHAHLSARKMRIHIFRNNSKFITLSDEHFQFHFQGFQFLPKEIKVLSTDIFVSECVYDTSDRTTTTIGADPTNQEMCNPDVLYYPRTYLSWCMSYPDKQQIFNLTGIQEVTNTTDAKGCEGYECQTTYLTPGIEPTNVILSPPEFANQTLLDHMMKFNNWTSERIQKLSDIYLQKQTPVCLADFASINTKDLVPLEFPTAAKSMKETNLCSN